MRAISLFKREAGTSTADAWRRSVAKASQKIGDWIGLHILLIFS